VSSRAFCHSEAQDGHQQVRDLLGKDFLERDGSKYARLVTERNSRSLERGFEERRVIGPLLPNEEDELPWAKPPSASDSTTSSGVSLESRKARAIRPARPSGGRSGADRPAPAADPVSVKRPSRST
jgi:hypothetical protein